MEVGSYTNLCHINEAWESFECAGDQKACLLDYVFSKPFGPTKASGRPLATDSKTQGLYL